MQSTAYGITKWTSRFRFAVCNRLLIKNIDFNSKGVARKICSLMHQNVQRVNRNTPMGQGWVLGGRTTTQGDTHKRQQSLSNDHEAGRMSEQGRCI